MDSGVPDPGGPRYRSFPGQCKLPQERSWQKERRLRLTMDPISPRGGPAAGQLSSPRSDLRDSLAMAAQRKPHRNGGGARPAYSKSAGSNELTNPPRVE